MEPYTTDMSHSYSRFDMDHEYNDTGAKRMSFNIVKVAVPTILG
jgi:hypothetical protein